MQFCADPISYTAVRGSNRISRAAAHRTPDNGLRRHLLRCSAKKSVTVVEACQDQRSHQGVRGLNGERPTDRPELADVKVTRPHQPGDVLGETNGGINIRSEIANRLRCCIISPPMVIESKVHLARRVMTCRTQPDEFRLRWIQPQVVA